MAARAKLLADAGEKSIATYVVDAAGKSIEVQNAPQQQQEDKNETGDGDAESQIDLSGEAEMDLSGVSLEGVDFSLIGTDDTPTDIEIELATALGSRKEKDTKDTPSSKQKNPKRQQRSSDRQAGNPPAFDLVGHKLDLADYTPQH